MGFSDFESVVVVLLANRLVEDLGVLDLEAVEIEGLRLRFQVVVLELLSVHLEEELREG